MSAADEVWQERGLLAARTLIGNRDEQAGTRPLATPSNAWCLSRAPWLLSAAANVRIRVHPLRQFQSDPLSPPARSALSLAGFLGFLGRTY